MSERGWIALDTNVICRHALDDHDQHSPRAKALFERVAQGEAHVFCPSTAIFEAIYVLNGRNESPRADVATYFATILEYPGFHPEHPESIGAAFELWTGNPVLDFADCYHLALTKELGMTQIYTFDKKMDRFPGVERIEP
jgi:predicted nucleic acid-binding protein